VLYRHGDRNPLNAFPDDPYGSYWTEQGLGELTSIGKQQHYALGQYLRARYQGYLNEYNPDYVYVRSTDVDRTLMSALADLAGLYPPTEDQVWDEDLDWQPIPVHTVPEEEDLLMETGSDCPRYILQHAETLASAPVLEFMLQNEVLIQQMVNYLGGSGLTLDTVWDMFDAINIERMKNMTLPDWVDTDWDQLEDINTRYFYELFPNHITQRLKGGPLLKEWISNINNTIAAEDSTQLFVYSGHDDNIVAVQQALQVYTNNTPPYAAAMMVELHQIDGEYQIQILYRNDSTVDPYVLTVPGCTSLCPVKQFVYLTEDMIPGDVQQECQLNTLSELNIDLSN
jgi:lysosomal acid phosphatase